MSLVKEIEKRSNNDASLIRAVIKQLGGTDEFKQSAPDIMNNGISGGFHGFIYHAETVSFARRHRKQILAMADSMADDLGESSGYALIAGFNCLRDLKLDGGQVAAAIYDPNHEDHTQVMNALAWFAGEEVSRAYADK